MFKTGNYYELVQDLNFDKMPSEFKEMHQIINESTDNGEDWSLYKEDKESMEVLQLYFDKLNAYLEKNTTKEPNSKFENNKKPAKYPTFELFKQNPILWIDKRSYGKNVGNMYNPSVRYGKNTFDIISYGTHEFTTLNTFCPFK